MVRPSRGSDDHVEMTVPFPIVSVFRSSNGDWGRVFKTSFNQKLESIMRKNKLKLASLPSLKFYRWITTMLKAFKNQKKLQALYGFGDAIISELETFVCYLGDV